ncbi:MAG: molybdopterin-dependent oxidoreductase [Myxococcales bacterium]|nr:molybdopterin-dependent oxidoreductase [Myxococcales bacterium]
MTSPRTHFTTCNLCEAMCGLSVTVDGGKITDIRGDHDDTFSAGHICPKALGLREIYEDPDRLRQPQRRTKNGFVPISWDEALSEVASKLSAIRSQYGRNAIGIYAGNPTVHNLQALLGYAGFLRAVGTKNRFDANSQDANPRLLTSLLLYGEQTVIPVPDIDRTSYMLMLGANPAASGGSLMTMGDVKNRVRGVKARGGKLVLIDPRRSETSEWASEHHFIRPGGDAALLLAILHVLIAEQKVRWADVRRRSHGSERIESLARDFAPADVAPAIGIPAETIVRIAREFAAAPSAVAYGRIGVCQQELGTTTSWLIDVLNLLTGNLDREGGAMFPQPAFDLGTLSRKVVNNHHGRWRSRVRGLPEVGGNLPAAVMAEEMETPGPGQIRGFVSVLGNPVASVPNSARLDRALAGLEFMVSLDFYINETSRHAHIILPGSHALERSQYDVVFHALQVRNTTKYSLPVLPPAPDSRTDWDILYDLSMRLGGVRVGLPLLDKALQLAHRVGLRPTPDLIVDLAVRTGKYGDKLLPGREGLSLRKLKEAPHGIDLGPLQPCLQERIRTQDGQIQLAPPILVDDVARVKTWLTKAQANAQQADAGLVLIGRRQLRTNNSWMHNCPSLTKGPDRSALLMNPHDASRLSLQTGQHVQVESRVGTVTVKLSVTDEVMPGVVSLPHGFGHQQAAATLRVAGPLPGANVNLLTDDLVLDPLSGTASLHGVPVRVTPAPTPSHSQPASPTP